MAIAPNQTVDTQELFDGVRPAKLTMTSRCESGQRRDQATFVAARQRRERSRGRSAGSSPLLEGASHQSAA